MLDELCSLARDLLILRTAPRPGIQLSGSARRRRCGTLERLLSAGELLRITAVLRDTASGFQAARTAASTPSSALCACASRSARLDAEPRSMPACAAWRSVWRAVSCPSRLRRRRSTAQQEQAAPEEPEAAPEPQQSAPSEAPPGFWPELVKRLKTTLPLPEQAMFSTQDNAPVRGTLHGDVLELQTETEFVRNLINKPEALRPVSDAATALLGRPVRVRIASGKAEKPNEGFERLVSFGQEHPELVDLK